MEASVSGLGSDRRDTGTDHVVAEVRRRLWSTNGTFVNGYSIRGETLLMPDYTLRVGATRFLVVYVPGARGVPEASGVVALAGQDVA